MFSTTIDEKVAKRFAKNALFKINVELYDGKSGIKHPNFGNCAFFMENLTAVKDENEILFPSGTYFLVVKVLEPNKNALNIIELNLYIPFKKYYLFFEKQIKLSERI